MLPDTPRIRSRLDLLYLIAREFNAGLDIDQVLHRVLAATVASVAASDARLFLFDAEGKLEKFFLISGFEVQERSRAALETTYEQGLVAWVKKHRKRALVKDAHTDERWVVDDSTPELGKARSAISVPIQLPEQLIGILTITATEPDHFDESDLAVLTIIADQAAFAITNARLFEAEQHRRRLADTLASIARTINSTLDLNEVLNLILEQLALVIDYDSSSILLYDDGGETLSVRAGRGFEDIKDALKVTIPVIESSPNYRAIIQKRPVIIGDVDAAPGWIKSSSTRDVRSWIGAPLIARDEVIGMLTVDSREVDKYTEENVAEVAAFADYAATAVANAQIVTRLQSAESSYTTLFEDSTDLIAISTYDGLILNVNRKACQMLRRPKDALIGGYIDFVDPRLRDFLAKQTRRLKVWREASIEIDVLDAYRETVSLELKIRQVYYDGRDCVQWVGRDISARKEIERMRQDLVNMLVHDLRGPLGNLINTIELLPKLLGALLEQNPKLANILDMARRSGQEVQDLVDSMLDVSRLEQGEVPLQRGLVDLGQLLDAVNDQVYRRAEDKDMELIYNLHPETPQLWIDGGMIRRVLINLIDNAIKYTPYEGQVSLTITPYGDKVNFTIADNGPGISKADQAQIFDKFSRVDYSTNTPSGVGLGLAFCKLAVEAHGGAISVKSEGVPGKGSTFHFSIPIIQPKRKR